MDPAEIKYRVELANEMACPPRRTRRKAGLAPLLDAPSSPASVAIPAASTKSLFASDSTGVSQHHPPKAADMLPRNRELISVYGFTTSSWLDLFHHVQEGTTLDCRDGAFAATAPVVAKPATARPD